MLVYVLDCFGHEYDFTVRTFILKCYGPAQVIKVVRVSRKLQGVRKHTVFDHRAMAYMNTTEIIGFSFCIIHRIWIVYCCFFAGNATPVTWSGSEYSLHFKKVTTDNLCFYTFILISRLFIGWLYIFGLSVGWS